MDDVRFDDFARSVARARPRRTVLRALLGALLGGITANPMRPALADHCQTGSHCGATRPGRVAPCCNGSQICCTNGAGDGFCCAAATHECASPCGCVPKGATCCCGSNPGCTICPSDRLCCKLDSGNETCCYPDVQVCDPTFSCRSACPEGRATCGQFCCRDNERCDPDTDSCIPCPTGLTYCPSGACVDFETDPANCGGCGFDCREIGKEFCKAGKCLGECETDVDCADGVCQKCVENHCTPICAADQICCVVSEAGSGTGSAWCCGSSSTCCGDGLCCSSGEQCENDVCKLRRDRDRRRQQRRKRRRRR